MIELEVAIPVRLIPIGTGDPGISPGPMLRLSTGSCVWLLSDEGGLTLILHAAVCELVFIPLSMI